MKKIFLIILIGIGLHACKKGDTGPQGPTGPQGIQGVKGDNGTMIYSGNDVPAASLGINGDFYFRLSNSTFYGPKTAAGWGTPVSLRGATGATGATGAAGSKILSGTALPTTSDGAVGDFYFKSDNYLFFGPKTASGWGSGVNLKGATGTANVIYSGWSTLVRLKDSTIDMSNVRIGHIYAPRITAAVQNSAAVLMYLDYGGGAFPMPYTSNAGGRMSSITYKLKTNEIVVYRMVYDGGALINLVSTIKYRYVIIPGGVVATLKEKNIDLSNPFAVDNALKKLQLQ